MNKQLRQSSLLLTALICGCSSQDKNSMVTLDDILISKSKVIMHAVVLTTNYEYVILNSMQGGLGHTMYTYSHTI